MELYHGDIVYSENSEKLNVFEDSWLAVEDGKVEGIYKEIPEKFSNVPVTDHGRGLIIPRFRTCMFTHRSISSAGSGWICC